MDASRRCFVLVAAATFAWSGGLVHAQATRTWVSGVGDDANPCSRTAPGKTFAGAISKTAAGGEIDALDPGGFGTVTITKAIIIDGGAGVAGVLAAGVNGIVINAGPTDVVTLRNLSIVGHGTGLDGIKFIAGAAVNVEHCYITGFTGNGINVAVSGFANLTVSDCTITNCAQSGVSVLSSGGTVFSSIERSLVTGCTTGMNGDTGSRLAVRYCDLTLNTTGLICQKSALNSRADLDTCLFAYSANAIQAGPGATTVRITNCTVNNNTTALFANGGTFYSTGNNNLMGNTSDGATPVLISQK